MADPRDAATTESPTRDALRAAFEEHYLPLLRLCVVLSGRAAVAEDIVQEAFVRLAPRIDRVDRQLVYPYLRQTAMNLWRNRLRRLAVERRAGKGMPEDRRERGVEFATVEAILESLD